MKNIKCSIFLVLAGILGCTPEDEAQLSIVTYDFDFSEGREDWSHGFADFPANPEDSAAFELRFAYSEPVESKITKRSLLLSGKNLNQDLFMYIKRRITDLKPDTDYTVTFNVELTSDLQYAQQNTGGSVYLKAGATLSEPNSVIEGGTYVMNLDKGNQDASGADMITLGNLVTDGMGTAYSLVTRSNTMANSRYIARTDANGDLWLVVGTDSSVSGTTKIFYTRIKVVLSVS